MNWLWLYLLTGCLVLIGFLLKQYRMRRKNTSPLLDGWNESPPGLKPLGPISKAARYAIAVLIISLLTILAWPGMLAAEIWTGFANRRTLKEREKPEFEVKKEDLIEELTQQQIEARERVVDPLQAVPPLPFGHLHTAWITFLETIQPEYTLWSFEAERQESAHRKEHRIGYVIVKGREIGPHFVVSIKQTPS